MYTAEKSGRTGYGNKAYRKRRLNQVNPLTIDGFILLILGAFSLLLLYRVLTRENGFKTSWQSVLAIQVVRTVSDAIQRYMVNIGE